jgi:hypothetical protein
MRQTVVPAQVTTVEDRIMGNLGFAQLTLLVLPLFVGVGLYLLLPPFAHGSLYKYLIIGFIAAIMAILAIRIKGKIILLWLVTIVRYNLRPTYYIFNKNTVSYREQYLGRQHNDPEQDTPTAKAQPVTAPKLAFHEAAYALELLHEPTRRVSFEMNKKGGLHVRLTEIED